jgi:hypothetical protein
MAQVSQEKVRAKINQVRAAAVVNNVSNDEIVLVLQYYDYDVERAIAAFMEDGAHEALQQWHYSGPVKTAPSKKKKKKNKNSKPTINGTTTTSNGIDCVPASLLPVVNGCASVDGGSIGSLEGADNVSSTPSVVTPVIDVSVQPPLLSASPPRIDVSASHKSGDGKVVVTEARPAGDVAAVSVEPKAVVVANGSVPKNRANASVDYQHQPKKAGRDRTTSENDVRSTAVTAAALSETVDHRSAVSKKPHAGLEKSCKDLHRQTVSLERLKVILNENMDKSFKRLTEVFKELHAVLNEREALLTAELTAIKVQANEVLSEQQAKAFSLQQQTDRSHSLSEKDMSQLRADIKHFVGERKTYEDLSMTQRFTCEVGPIFDAIRSLGEVSAIKLPSPTDARRLSSVSSATGGADLVRQHSDCCVSVSSDVTSAPPTPRVTSDVTNAPPTPSVFVDNQPSQPAEVVNVAAACGPTSFHVLTQSDSLTRYERERKQQQLVTGSATSNTAVVPSSASPRAARSDSSRGGGRGRGSPRRGSGGRAGQDGGRHGGGRGGAAADGRGSNYSANRTFVSRNVSNGPRGDERTNAGRKSSSPDHPRANAAAAVASSNNPSVVVSNDVACAPPAAVIVNGSTTTAIASGRHDNRDNRRHDNHRSRGSGLDRTSPSDRGARSQHSDGGISGHPGNNNWQHRNGFQKHLSATTTATANGKASNSPSSNGGDAPKLNGNHTPPDNHSTTESRHQPDSLPQRTNYRRSRGPGAANSSLREPLPIQPTQT